MDGQNSGLLVTFLLKVDEDATAGRVDFSVTATNVDYLDGTLQNSSVISYGNTHVDIVAPVTLSIDPGANGSLHASSTAPDDYMPGTAITAQVTADSGFTFSHWTASGAGVGVSPPPAQVNINNSTANPLTFNMPNGDVTLIAHYNTTRTVTVNDSRLAAGTGSTQSGQGNYAEGASATIRAGADNADQEFVNWRGTSVGGVTFPNATRDWTFTVPAGNVTATAHWRYRLTVASTTATGVGTTGWHEQGVGVTLNAGTPIDPEHEFRGWNISPAVTFTNSTSRTTQAAQFNMPKGPVTATAVWGRVGSGDDDPIMDPPGTYRLYIVNGGEGATPAAAATEDGARVNSGQTINVFAGTREGVEFVGWKVETAAEVVITPTLSSARISFTMPANVVTLTAEWSDGPPVVERVEDPIVLDPQIYIPMIEAAADGDCPRPSLHADYSSRTFKDKDRSAIVIPKATALALIEADMDVVVKTPTIIMELSPAALKAAHAVEEDDLYIEINFDDSDDAGPAYDFKYIAGGGNAANVTNLGFENVTIALPYEADDDQNKNTIVALHLSSGEVTRSKYLDGYVVFITQRAGKFMVVEMEPKSFTDEAITRPGMYDHIDFVSVRELFKGNRDGSFNPNGNITYGELAAVLANYDKQEFSNFPADHIDWAEKNGIFEGVKYEPFADATRADMAKMIYNYIQYSGMKACTIPDRDFSFSDIADSDAEEEIIALANMGIISGDTGSGGLFRPNSNIARDEVAAIISQLVKAFCICCFNEIK
jgi:hypothetical protein